jgi:hypothetical protein
MKKKFENFLKQLGDSPKKKRNISANAELCEVPMYSSEFGRQPPSESCAMWQAR